MTLVLAEASKDAELVVVGSRTAPALHRHRWPARGHLPAVQNGAQPLAWAPFGCR